MERDYWYTTGRGLSDLLAPRRWDGSPRRGRSAAWARGRCRRRRSPSSSTPRRRRSSWAPLFSALSGYAVFRNATFLKDRVGQQVASPLLTLVDDGRRHRGLGSRPFDGEGLPTRRNVPVEKGVLRHFMCDSYSGRKIGSPPTGSARRGVGGGPSVGASNLSFEPGAHDPRGDPGRGRPRALRHGPHRLRGRPRLRRLLAGRGRALDREGPSRPSRSRGHDRGQPQADAARRGRGGQRPGVAGLDRLPHPPRPEDDDQRELSAPPGVRTRGRKTWYGPRSFQA